MHVWGGLSTSMLLTCYLHLTYPQRSPVLENPPAAVWVTVPSRINDSQLMAYPFAVSTSTLHTFDRLRIGGSGLLLTISLRLTVVDQERSHKVNWPQLLLNVSRIWCLAVEWAVE